VSFSDLSSDFLPYFFSKTAKKQAQSIKISVSNPASLHATRTRIQVRSGLSGPKIQKNQEKISNFSLKHSLLSLLLRLGLHRELLDSKSLQSSYPIQRTEISNKIL
jgi:hypothetical protein